MMSPVRFASVGFLGPQFQFHRFGLGPQFGSGPLGVVPQVCFTRMVRKSGLVNISFWVALEPENELLLVLGKSGKIWEGLGNP